MSFQEMKNKEKNKLLLQQHFTFHAFHPKAVNVVVSGRSSDFPDFLSFLPIPCSGTVVAVAKKFAMVCGGITATGIVPDLHRTSLLIICLRQMNQVRGKCKGRICTLLLIL